MSLPTLNSDYTFDLVIPSTGETVQFRPYLVREEKMLLMALESQKSLEMMKAMKNIIDACFKGVDASKLCLYDVEYCFVNLRAKSAGEIAQIEYGCSHCGADNPIALDLESLKVSDKPESETIQLTDNIYIKMRYPTLADAIRNPDLFASTMKANNLIGIISILIDSVMTEDSIIKFADETEAERNNFIESLNSKQFEKIKKWIEDSPRCSLNIKFTCSSCETENDVDLVGVQNFFT